MEEHHPRREVKRIVIGYDLKSLPPALFRSFNLLRGKLARRRLRVEVLIRPISKLPPDTDVLFVPAELLEQAQQIAPYAARIGLLDPRKTYQKVFDEFLKDLEAGAEIYALRVDEAGDLERTGARGGVIVRYRGNERVS